MTRSAPKARLSRRDFLTAAFAACLGGTRVRRTRLSLRSPEIGRMARWAG